MTVRYYVMPITVVDGTYRGPKYFKWRFNPTGIACQWSMKDYGLISACLCAADVTDAQHATLSGYSDVACAPVNIDNTLAGALAAVRNVLEALRVPADWATASNTYREVLRMFGGLCMFAQRYHGMWAEQLIDSQAQLDTRWSQIPLARRQRIIETADAMGYDYSSVQNNWQVRRILKLLSDQWADTPILFGFTTL